MKINRWRVKCLTDTHIALILSNQLSQNPNINRTRHQLNQGGTGIFRSIFNGSHVIYPCLIQKQS